MINPEDRAELELEVCRRDTCVSCQRRISTGGANNTDNHSVLSRPSLWEADTCRIPPLRGPWRIPLFFLWHLENVVYEQGNLSRLWEQGADGSRPERFTATLWPLKIFKNLLVLLRDGFSQKIGLEVGFGTETFSVGSDYRWDRAADLQLEVRNLSSSLTSRMETSNVI